MSQTNLNTLRWVTDRNDLFENKWYAYGKVFKLVCPVGRFIPFQLPKILDNNDITSFKLIRRETGEEIDVLAEMEAMGLYIDRNAYENYSNDSIDNQQAPVPVGATSWGFSIGAAESFKFAKTRIYATQTAYTYHLIIKESRQGAVIGQTGGNFNGLTINDINEIEFTFLDLVENTNNSNLWFELRMSDEFWFVGRSDFVVDPPQDAPNEEDHYGTGGDLNNLVEPDQNAPGGVGEYSGWVQLYGSGDTALIVFPAFGSFTQTITPGLYDVEMSDGVTTWYSEPITMVDDVTCLPKITFFHRRNLDVETHERIFINGYRDWFYPYSQGAVKPDYKYFRKSSDELGLPKKIYTASWKEYRIVFPAPEWLADALRVLPLMDDVIIEVDGITLDVDDVQFNSEWTDQGHLTIIELTVIAERRVAQSNTNLPRLSTFDELGAWSTDGDEVWVDPGDDIIEDNNPNTGQTTVTGLNG